MSNGVEHICPAGSFCPAGSGSPIPCPNGTYSPTVGLVNRSGCLNCTSGYYCDAPTYGLAAPSGKCDAGYFCGSGSWTSRRSICPAGSFCANGSAFPTVCPIGTYAPVEGLGECLECPAGHWCGVETVTPNDCPAGYYCPNGTLSATQYPCPEGTWSNSTQLSAAGDCRHAVRVKPIFASLLRSTAGAWNVCAWRWEHVHRRLMRRWLLLPKWFVNANANRSAHGWSLWTRARLPARFKTQEGLSRRFLLH